MRSDHRTIAFDHAPVHATIVVASQIPARDSVEFRAAHIGADGIDQAIPTSQGVETSCGSNVPLAFRKDIKSFVEFFEGVGKALLLRNRKPDLGRPACPGWRRPVNRAALGLRNPRPRIAVGRMQPSAAKIDRGYRVIIIRPCPPSKPGSGFENETIDKRVPEPPRCSDSGGATADDCDLRIAALHSGSLRWLVVMHTPYAVSCWRRTRTGNAAVRRRHEPQDR